MRKLFMKNREIIFLKYKIEGSEDFIATTRPETII
jgi:valyl-tRNA synthetase